MRWSRRDAAELAALRTEVERLRAEVAETTALLGAAVDRAATQVGAAVDRSTGQVGEALDGAAAALHREVDAVRQAVEALPPPPAAPQSATSEADRSVHEALRRLAATTTAIAEALGAGAPPVVDGDGPPLVTVVVPVRDRAAELRRALASLVAQTWRRWECVVVDDGSTDDPADVVGRFADPRIRLEQSPATGVSAARNLGIDRTSAPIVAFLDSDNEWFPDRLARVVAALDADPAAGWAVDAIVVDDAAGGLPFVRDGRPSPDDLLVANRYDLNAVAVRRDVLDAAGRFDEELDRLVDWDLALRLTALAGPPLRVAGIGGRYRDDAPGRITTSVPAGPSVHRLRTKAIGRPGAGLRVLFAEWHYPQLTETYIEADLAGLVALGAHVEVWSECDVAVAYEPSVPVHRGDLRAVLSAVRPDVVVTHWLHKGLEYRPVTAALDLPHVVRGHGFDYASSLAADLLRDPGVAVHLYPHHHAAWAGHPRAVATPAAFDPGRYPPSTGKDRALVVRLCAGLTTKELELFGAVAARCPEHRFVLGLGTAFQVEARADEMVQRYDDEGWPVEVRRNVCFAEAAELVGRAGTYLHTHGTDHTLGMPVSIAEAMATGALVLARDLPGMGAYVGDAGLLYDGATFEDRVEGAAALVQATARWDDDRWAQATRASLDRAWPLYAADLVADGMLAAWGAVLGVQGR